MNGTADYSALDKDSTIRPDNSAKATVVFKPTKRMKKRRQLDALVSNGKLPRRKNSSGHELLRSNDSESSEVEEFSVLEGQKWGRRFPSTCCTTFYIVLVIVIMTACVLASATLVWMHLELKRDFNNLRARLALVENKNAGTPEEFQVLQSRLQAINRTLMEKTSGLDSLNKSIADIKNQISSLETRTNQLQQAIPPQGSNDNENKAVAGTVADLGSDLQSTKANVEELKNFRKTAASQLDSLSSRITALEKPGGREGDLDPVTANLLTQIGQMNTSFAQRIDQAQTASSKLEARLGALESFTTELQTQIQNVTSQVINVNQTRLTQDSILTEIKNLKQPSKETTGTGGDVNTSNLEQDVRITNLENQVQQLQQQVSQIQSDYSGLNNSHGQQGAADAEVISLKQDHEALNGSLTSLEESVDTLKMDVTTLFTRLKDSMGEVSSVTTVVTNYLKSQEEHAQLDVDTQQGEKPDFPSPETEAATSSKPATQRPISQSPAAANEDKEIPSTTQLPSSG